MINYILIWFIRFLIPSVGLMFGIFQYFNKRSGRKTKVLQKAIFFGVLLSFLFASIYTAINFKSSIKDAPIKCTFIEHESDTLNLLITPFQNLGPSSSSPALIIYNRLLEQIYNDSLKVKITLCDSLYLKNNKLDSHLNLLRETNSDLIIYGDYENFCDSNKICINWLSSVKLNNEDFRFNMTKKNCIRLSNYVLNLLGRNFSKSCMLACPMFWSVCLSHW